MTASDDAKTAGARRAGRGPAAVGGRQGWSSDRPEVVSKRSLVAVSHAIEQALLEGPLRSPTVVVALFQRLVYFEREYAVYERIAAAGAVVIIGFTDGQAHQVPPGAHAVVLEPTELLADEWTVIAVGPEAGAFLVATDAHRFDPTEQTLEAGREFTGRWGFSRVQAGNELARMRAALADRLDPAVGFTIDRLLAEVMPVGGAAAGSTGTDGERWATTSLHRMVARMQDARAGTRVLRAQLADAHAAAGARATAQVDPQSGLATPEFLSRWSNTGSPTALPVGVAVFDIAELDDASARLEARSAYHAARRVAAALTEPLGVVDAAVRLSEREFAVVVPGASHRHLRELVAAASEQLEWASDGYPHVALSATVASAVTLARPLPLDDLRLALGTPGQPAATRGEDPITVTSTADAASAGQRGGERAGPETTERDSRWLAARRVPATPSTDPPRHADTGPADGSRPRTGTTPTGSTSTGAAPTPEPRVKQPQRRDARTEVSELLRRQSRESPESTASGGAVAPTPRTEQFFGSTNGTGELNGKPPPGTTAS